MMSGSHRPLALSPLPTTIHPLSPSELDTLLPAFVDLLRDTVNGGVPLGFLAPLSHDQAREYWVSLRTELLTGDRLLLAAFCNGALAGTGQLAFAMPPNARHRVELQKLLVNTRLRGQGLGRALMEALHQAARERGRSLILLNTRRGLGAEEFYRGLGYREAGVIPGYTVDPAGRRYDTVLFFQELTLVTAPLTGPAPAFTDQSRSQDASSPRKGPRPPAE